MMKRYLSVFVVLVVIFAAACTKNQQERDKQAIQAALQKYLSERGTLNLAAMDMEIKQVTTTGNAAQALVEFRAKQGGFGMQVTYALERQGTAWVVKSTRHAGPMGAHPPIGPGAQAPPMPSTGQLPTGHPPLGDAGKAPAPAPVAPSKKP